MAALSILFRRRDSGEIEASQLSNDSVLFRDGLSTASVTYPNHAAFLDRTKMNRFAVA